ncbi:Disulfide bond formation protein DsbB [Roseovarius pacificus]|uniref:Disulfide bond formation protein DsbB n=1 Tax=Roseovarius pacificus TaxID=337701 RepID=A0A1M6XH07_9RHOB|nr:disulfide bond formation protein B [Roseovarius pacificus]GGO52156.1 dihydroneopterin aldolase [Roseovarius pacificus]SHL05193.1 Disulfide bond formation protein DsbB [Roseovarius pacificus]
MNEILTRRTLILIAAAGSAALMLGALGFQYIGGMPPCKLCLWQRYPHVAAILIGAVALALPRASLALAGAAATLTTAGIAFYHTGVERGWWAGPTSCSSTSPTGLSTDDLFDQIMAAPVIRCDEVPWEMFGLSMASWNMLASLALAAIWIMAARR